MGDPSGRTGEPTSVDSYLTLLFNGWPGADPGPTVIDGDSNATSISGCYPGTPRCPVEQNTPIICKGVPNPYHNKDVDFATFRASADNHIDYTIGGHTHHWKMRYLVCRHNFSLTAEQPFAHTTDEPAAVLGLLE